MEKNQLIHNCCWGGSELQAWWMAASEWLNPMLMVLLMMMRRHVTREYYIFIVRRNYRYCIDLLHIPECSFSHICMHFPFFLLCLLDRTFKSQKVLTICFFILLNTSCQLVFLLLYVLGLVQERLIMWKFYSHNALPRLSFHRVGMIIYLSLINIDQSVNMSLKFDKVSKESKW